MNDIELDVIIQTLKELDSVKKSYRIVCENEHLIYVKISGEIGLTFIRDLQLALKEVTPPVCILLRNTQNDLASLGTVGLLYKSAQDPRVKAVASFDLTSAQTLLVEWLLSNEGINTFHVFGDEASARAYLKQVCSE
ncbi:MAG: hypothetical protein GF311_27440 [Candidatus Lokiarchaeota archaeon]|nr:hypothetical protein [Candidatus Lokiarchaeota archaeon]